MYAHFSIERRLYLRGAAGARRSPRRDPLTERKSEKECLCQSTFSYALSSSTGPAMMILTTPPPSRPTPLAFAWNASVASLNV